MYVRQASKRIKTTSTWEYTTSASYDNFVHTHESNLDFEVSHDDDDVIAVQEQIN